jgi:protein phosphatase 2C family protein 2/3
LLSFCLKFFIIATDGVWEFITSHEAVSIIQACFDKGMGASDACEVLIKEAMAKWEEKEGDYRDDITAIIVRFKGLWDKTENG